MIQSIRKLSTLAAGLVLSIGLVGCGAGPAATPTVVITPTAVPTATVQAVPSSTLVVEPTATEVPTAEATATPEDTATATAEPTSTELPATEVPTEVPAQVSTEVAPTPTTAAENAATPTAGSPVFTFTPKGGGPGTKVTVKGANYKPNTHVVIRIGLPQPVGEALGSALTDEQGAWSTTVVIPGTLPSGQPITGTNMQLVAMDEDNQVVNTDAFDFAP